MQIMADLLLLCSTLRVIYAEQSSPAQGGWALGSRWQQA